MDSRPKKSTSSKEKPEAKRKPKEKPEPKRKQKSAGLRAEAVAPGKEKAPPVVSSRPDHRRRFKPINQATIIEPMWVAESIVIECCRWLGEGLPEEWVAQLAVKADKCFAGNRQFNRLIKAPENGIHHLRRFMRHWLAGLLYRHRFSLFKRLPYRYSLGVPPPATHPSGFALTLPTGSLVLETEPSGDSISDRSKTVPVLPPA